MKTIVHGVPDHDFFAIAVPYNKNEHKPIFDQQKPKYTLRDPKSGENTTVEAWDVWKFPIDDLPGALIRLIYGFSADVVKTQLLKKYPELEVNKKVSIILMKKL